MSKTLLERIMNKDKKDTVLVFAGDLQEVIKPLQSRIAELEEANRWIPVSDRLPEKGEPVLCGWQYDSISIMNLQVEHNLHKYWENNSGIPYAFESVTHWRPLPTPPEAD